MRALTLDQPYATAVALGLKRIETRGWLTHHRGPLAIHASATAKVGYKPVFYGAPPAHRAAFIAAGYADFWQLPQGEVVAVVDVLDVFPIDTVRAAAAISADEAHWGNYAPGRFGWRLGNVRRLATPVRARGHQGFWQWEPPADLRYT